MLFIPIVIVLVVFTILLMVTIGIVSAKRQSSAEMKGETGMKVIYVYAVLFATLMMSIGGSVGAFMAIADIVSPPAYYESFEQYKMTSQQKEGKQQSVTEEQLKKNYDDMILQQKALAKERAVNSLIKSLGWIVIPLPVFIYFQRRTKSPE